jgi:hypothetical protein
MRQEFEGNLDMGYDPQQMTWGGVDFSTVSMSAFDRLLSWMQELSLAYRQVS